MTTANSIYERINNKIKYGKVYIIYGDNQEEFNNINYKIKDNKFKAISIKELLNKKLNIY